MEIEGNFLDENFFSRSVFEVADELIGAILVKNGKQHQINELEIYDGEHDLACHASKGKTKRTEVMYGEAGYFYVYLCYGMYWMLNIVTGEEDYPSAILIRGAGNYCGPGILTRELKIDGTFNNKKAKPSTGLYFLPSKLQTKNVVKKERVGVNYAGNIWAKKPYRYILK